jgi:GNAT superfamily N-acetyltransferase
MTSDRMRLRTRLADVTQFPTDAVEAWRRRRVAGVWDEVAARTVDHAVRWCRALVLEHDVAACRDIPPPPGVSIREFIGGDWSALAPLLHRRARETFRAEAIGGRRCLVAWHDGRPLGHVWISPQLDRAVERYPLPLPADAAYIWRLEVAREVRQTGLGQALVSAAMQCARTAGFRRTWCLVAAKNTPSLRAFDKVGLGRTVVGELTFARVLGLEYSRFVPSTGASPDRARG